ncbi:unnamed protein product [Porites evermanni]|uniref:Coiled-coil domain-containing protein 137 n=1 Tax=Porites evermanni TaxID=104178 RepID=A0ABN8QH49_9CNID|nr:unnamed protein product [Porites evermanni]
MGRRSRHKKIKACDPFYKGPKKDGISSSNKTPLKNERLTDQRMPRAAKDLIRRQMALKKPTATMRKKDAKTKKRVTPKFQRIAGESKKQYFDRIDHEAANEVALSLKASRKLREARKRHLIERKQKMKEKKKPYKESADLNLVKDNVRFGEVAMEPPSLTAKPRKASKMSKGTKPLLLHSLISQDTDRKTENDKQTDTTEDSGTPKTKKRKHMSAVEREKADKERERAIMAYRLMRKQRLQGKKESL